MKKVLATTSLIVAIHLIAVLSSCCTDYNTLCFDFEGLEIQNLDNSGISPTEQVNDTIPAVAFILGIDYVLNDGFCLESTHFGWNPLTTALATSCAEEYTYLLNDSLISVEISSLTDFDADHPKGTALNSFFVGPDARTINQAIREFGNFRDGYYFLVKKPDGIRPHRFIAKMELSSGAIFADTTNSIVLSL
jgi:hypothetical protein